MLRDNVVPSVERGGSMVVWGCFSSTGTEDLVKIDGSMRKESYSQILEKIAATAGLRMIGHKFVSAREYFTSQDETKNTV